MDTCDEYIGSKNDKGLLYGYGKNTKTRARQEHE